MHLQKYVFCGSYLKKKIGRWRHNSVFVFLEDTGVYLLLFSH